MVNLLGGYLPSTSGLKGAIHTVKQAGPETLMMAMAARPGALDRANIVGSSIIGIVRALLQLLLLSRGSAAK